MGHVSIRYAGFVVFLVLMGVDRVLAERALRYLNAEEVP